VPAARRKNSIVVVKTAEPRAAPARQPQRHRRASRADVDAAYQAATRAGGKMGLHRITAPKDAARQLQLLLLDPATTIAGDPDQPPGSYPTCSIIQDLSVE